MTEIQPPRYDLIERNNADARALAARAVVEGINLDDAIKALKQQYGFSDQAWDIFVSTIQGSAEDDIALERYREREDKIEAILREVGECWICTASTRGIVYHDDGCPLAPVEKCNAPVDDVIQGGTIPCPLREGHEGKHWPD